MDSPYFQDWLAHLSNAYKKKYKEDLKEIKIDRVDTSGQDNPLSSNEDFKGGKIEIKLSSDVSNTFTKQFENEEISNAAAKGTAVDLVHEISENAASMNSALLKGTHSGGDIHSLAIRVQNDFLGYFGSEYVLNPYKKMGERNDKAMERGQYHEKFFWRPGSYSELLPKVEK